MENRPNSCPRPHSRSVKVPQPAAHQAPRTMPRCHREWTTPIGDRPLRVFANSPMITMASNDRTKPRASQRLRCQAELILVASSSSSKTDAVPARNVWVGIRIEYFGIAMCQSDLFRLALRIDIEKKRFANKLIPAELSGFEFCVQDSESIVQCQRSVCTIGSQLAVN